MGERERQIRRRLREDPVAMLGTEDFRYLLDRVDALEQRNRELVEGERIEARVTAEYVVQNERGASVREFRVVAGGKAWPGDQPCTLVLLAGKGENGGE